MISAGSIMRETVMSEKVNYVTRIGRKLFAGRKQATACYPRLGKQKAVKGIFVYLRKFPRSQDMTARDNKLAVSVVQTTAVKRNRINLKIRTAKPFFHDNFPNTCGTEKKGIVGIGNILNCIFWQRPGGGPNEYMGVKEYLHAFPSKSAVIASCPRVSKSDGTETLPCKNPMRVTTGGAAPDRPSTVSGKIEAMRKDCTS
jgi:hypothetical protein